VKTFYYCDCL